MKAPGESFCFSPVFNSWDWGREIGNFGMDQLRDMGRTSQRWPCLYYESVKNMTVKLAYVGLSSVFSYPMTSSIWKAVLGFLVSRDVVHM